MLSNYELVRGVIRIASAISSTFTKSSLANEAFLARSRRLSAQVLFENYPSLFKYMYLFRQCFLLDFARPHSKNFAIISQISPTLVERAVVQTEIYLCSGRRK